MKKIAKILSLTLVFVMALALFTACVPSNVEAAEKKMKDAGYSVEEYVDYEADNDEGIIGGIYAIKSESLLNVDSIIAIYFETSKQAKEYAENWEDSMFSEIGYEGRWAYAGTEDAIEDFKK